MENDQKKVRDIMQITEEWYSFEIPEKLEKLLGVRKKRNCQKYTRGKNENTVSEFQRVK